MVPSLTPLRATPEAHQAGTEKRRSAEPRNACIMAPQFAELDPHNFGLTFLLSFERAVHWLTCGTSANC